MDKKFHTYLCGPMEAVREKEATNWRDKVTPKLVEIFKDQIEIVDPCKTEGEKVASVLPAEMGMDDVKEKIKGWKRSGAWDKFDIAMGAIEKADLAAVAQSTFILAFVDFNVIMGGTLDEIKAARDQKIPVYIVTYSAISEANSWNVYKCRMASPHLKLYESFAQALAAIEADYKEKLCA